MFVNLDADYTLSLFFSPFLFFKPVLIITWIITGQTIFVFIFHLKPIWNSFYKFILFVFYLKNRYEILFLKFILLSSIPKTYWNSFHKIHSFIFYLKNIFEILFMKFIFFFYLKNISEIIFIKLILSCSIILDLYFLLKI